MIIHIQILFFIIFAFEILIFFKIKTVFFDLLKTIKNFVNYIFLKKKISDKWKEIASLKYSIKIFSRSFKIFTTLFFIVLFGILINYYNNNFLIYLFSITGIIETVIISIIYILLRKKIYD